MQDVAKGRPRLCLSVTHPVSLYLLHPADDTLRHSELLKFLQRTEYYKYFVRANRNLQPPKKVLSTHDPNAMQQH